MQLGRDRLGDRQQLDLLALRLLQPFDQKRLFERAGRVPVDRLGQLQIGLAERPRPLVQHLGDADRVAVAVAQRHAQDIAGAVAGAAVDLRVEARVLVGVGDDLGGAGAEHRAGDAGIGRDADLGHAVAAQHARKQLAGVAVVQKQGRPLGVQRFQDQVDQPRQLAVEREFLGDRVGHLGQHPQPADFVEQRLGRRRFRRPDGGGRRRLGRQLRGHERMGADEIRARTGRLTCIPLSTSGADRSNRGFAQRTRT